MQCVSKKGKGKGGCCLDGGKDKAEGGGKGMLMGVVGKVVNCAAPTTKQPQVRIDDVDVVLHLGNADWLTFKVKVAVYNPFSRAIPNFTATCIIKINDSEVLRSTIQQHDSLKAKEETVLEMTVPVQYGNIGKAVEKLYDEMRIRYELELVLTFSLAILRCCPVKSSYKGEKKIPTASDIGQMLHNAIFGNN